MASSPEGSPPSPSSSSPPPSSTDKSPPSPPPPQSASPPPPKSSPQPEESKSSPPPSLSSSPPPPPTTTTPPPPPPPSSSPSPPPPTPPSSSSSAPPPPSSASPPPSSAPAAPPPPPPLSSPPPPTPTSSSSSPPTPPLSSSSPPTPPSSSPSPPTPPSSSSSPTTQPSSSSSPTTPSSSSESSSPPTPPSSSSESSSPPTPPSSSSESSPPSPSNNNGSNQNNAAITNPTPSSSSSPPPPPKLTSENSSSTLSSSPRLSPPPSSTNIVSESESDTSSSQSLPIIIGVSVGVVLLFTLIIALIIATCNRKKKKSDNHMQYYNNSTPPQGGVGYGNASSLAQAGQMNKRYQANDHLVINLPSPRGGNAGRGGWQQTPSPQGQTPSSSEMSPNLHGPTLPPAYPSPLGLNQSPFTYEELAVATYGFSQANLLGQGGFGFVHKGVLPNGKEVAVKSLKSGSGQGEREFKAEVEIISRVHHRHLVTLVGYSMAGDKKMLVYEFVPNKTLEFHLHEKGLPTMDWPTRLKIALGAAKGLAYLHEDCHPRIIHRDIKSANILLDFSFEAKVADFGLAKLTQDDNTHVSTRVMGTFGYLAPEYASSGKLTDKSDVFSFGVVLLELITGRRPLDLTSDMDESLVEWARPLCASAMENGNLSQLVDPRLENNFVRHEMARLVACAAACVRHSARRRPKMRQIVRALEDDVSLDYLNEDVRPGQSSRFSSTSGSNDYDSSSYSADMKNFRKLALDSLEIGSSNFGDTSEYGLNPSSSSSDSSGTMSRRQPEGNSKFIKNNT